jgi:hypothetical protein
VPSTSLSQPEEIRTRKGHILAVREYAGEDSKALVEMYRDFEPKREAQGLPPPDLSRIERWLQEIEPKSRWVIALSRGRIVDMPSCVRFLLSPSSSPSSFTRIFAGKGWEPSSRSGRSASRGSLASSTFT